MLRRYGDGNGAFPCCSYSSRAAILLKSLWSKGQLQTAVAALDAEDEEQVTFRANRASSEIREFAEARKRLWRKSARVW